MYPHNVTDGNLSVQQLPILLVKNHSKPSGSFMKEACSLDPGWRVLTCQCPDMKQSSATEKHTLLWAGDGVGRESLCEREHMPCL